jgi:Tfp pilus assembly protein PilN
MKTIDFLPESYRQREALRQARVWWGLVIVVFGLAIGSAAGAQAWLRLRLELQLAELGPHYVQAQAQARELAAPQSQLASANQEASLFTYLEHPWPRTQILAHLTQPLPDSIRLTQVHISEHELSRDQQPSSGARRRGAGEKDDAEKLPPAQDDLARMQVEMDFRQVMVSVEGFTSDVPDLHAYVAAINDSPLVAAAEIKSFESSLDKGPTTARTQFRVDVTVRKAHGQVGSQPPSPSAGSQRATARRAPFRRSLVEGGGQ